MASGGVVRAGANKGANGSARANTSARGAVAKGAILNVGVKSALDLRRALASLADESYKIFTERLVKTEPVLGVRVPLLRKFAAQNAPDLIKLFESGFAPAALEESVCIGLSIGALGAHESQKIALTKALTPHFRSWASVDLCALKLKKDKDLWLSFVKTYERASDEFGARYFYVMLLKNFLQEQNLDYIFGALAACRSNAYYAKMAVAWAICESFVAFAPETRAFLKRAKLDAATRKMAMAKIRQSTRAKHYGGQLD